MKKKIDNNLPLISVIMPVYNAGAFLVDAITSILNQTHDDFEFIIVDDRSTDGSWQVLTSFAARDKRIKLYRNNKHLGISFSINRAIQKAKGDFLARMDADDISHPQRLAKQLAYLQTHPQTVAIGTQCFLIDATGSIIGQKAFPVSFQEIYRYIYQFVPVQHPTLMIARKRLPETFNFYQEKHHTAEDVELLFKLFQYGNVENLTENLFLYRLHTTNNSLKNLKRTFYLTLWTRLRALFVYGYRPTLYGVMISISQFFLVSLLPSPVIFTLYRLFKHVNGSLTLLILPFRKLAPRASGALIK